MNDVLDPLGREYGVNIITGLGELSYIRCVQLVERAQDRPVRILYVSDFDPAGMSMPVAVARKIEFALYDSDKYGLVDIQVRPVVLTHDQCIEYRLPRTPIKATEKRANFEDRFGDGATELDALEALHPGKLRRILIEEIERYYDGSLQREINATELTVRADMADVERQIYRRHAKDIAALKVERKKLAKIFAAAEKKMKPILQRIERDLAAAEPDINAYDWPEPKDGDEDENPLFDSTRDYVEQIDRYKELRTSRPVSN